MEKFEISRSSTNALASSLSMEGAFADESGDAFDDFATEEFYALETAYYLSELMSTEAAFTAAEGSIFSEEGSKLKDVLKEIWAWIKSTLSNITEAIRNAGKRALMYLATNNTEAAAFLAVVDASPVDIDDVIESKVEVNSSVYKNIDKTIGSDNIMDFLNETFSKVAEIYTGFIDVGKTITKSVKTGDVDGIAAVIEDGEASELAEGMQELISELNGHETNLSKVFAGTNTWKADELFNTIGFDDKGYFTGYIAFTSSIKYMDTLRKITHKLMKEADSAFKTKINVTDDQAGRMRITMTAFNKLSIKASTLTMQLIMTYIKVYKSTLITAKEVHTHLIANGG